MREGLNPRFLLVLGAACILVRAQRGGCTRISGLGVPQPHSSISLIPLWLSAVNRPARFGRGRKAETRATPQKRGGHAAPDSGTEYHTAIRPHGVALVLIYPCGKAQKQPPGAALKARRRTYEMARGRPLSPGALAPARWPDELEKPDPGFRRPGLAGRARFRAVGLGRVSRRAIRCKPSGSGALFFRRCVVCRVELCTASLPLT